MRRNPMPSITARLFAAVLRVACLHRWLPGDGDEADLFVAARRKSARPPSSMMRRFDIRRDRWNGCEVYVITPKSRKRAGHVLFLHGGAYVYPIMGLHWRFIAWLVERSGFTFTVPLYPLAPTHDCAQAIDFVTDLYRRYLPPDALGKTVVMGDAAGGGLALSLAMQWHAQGITPLVGLVLISPWLDVTMADPSQDKLGPSHLLLMRPGIRKAGRWYAGAMDTADMNLHYHEEPGLLHCYPLLSLPEARRAEADIVSFLNAQLGGSQV